MNIFGLYFGCITDQSFHIFPENEEKVSRIVSSASTLACALIVTLNRCVLWQTVSSYGIL